MPPEGLPGTEIDSITVIACPEPMDPRLVHPSNWPFWKLGVGAAAIKRVLGSKVSQMIVLSALPLPVLSAASA